MARKKKPLVPGSQLGLQKLQEEILKEIRPHRTPMREEFRAMAAKILEQSEDSSTPE